MASIESTSAPSDQWAATEETHIRISIANAVNASNGNLFNVEEGDSIYESQLLTTNIPTSLRTWTLIRDVLEEHEHHASRLAVMIADYRGKLTDDALSVWLEFVLKYHGIIAGPETGSRPFKNSDSLSVILGLRQYGREFTDDECRKLTFATGFLDSNHLDETIVNDYTDPETMATYSVFRDMELVQLVVDAEWSTLRAVVDGVKESTITRVPQLTAALSDGNVALSEGVL